MTFPREEPGFAGDRTWVWAVAASALGHLVLAAVILLGPMISLPRHRENIRVLDVALVGAPDAGPAQARPATEPEVKAPLVKKPEKLPEPVTTARPEPPPRESKPEPLGPPTGKPPVKTALKKKSFDPDTVRQSALANLERQVEQERQTAIAKALDSARQQAGVAVGSGAPGTPGSDRLPDYLDEYAARLKDHVNRSWACPESLAGSNRFLEAVVVVTIEKNGHIKESWFERRSGNTYYDESVQRAVAKADPAPPLPGKFPDATLTLGLTFTPPR
ncbi:MAG: TonB family protein [Proteobacteria bacterium]|nr:TonB family protein [Pseudomonadota bacterium]